MATPVVLPTAIADTIAKWFRVEIGGNLYDPQWARKPHSITSTDNETIRFELRDGEQHWWDADNGRSSERVELTGKTLYNNNEPIHLSYGFKLEDGAPNTAKWTVFGQLHLAGEWNEGVASPPFSIGLVGEKMAIYIGYTNAAGKNIQVKIFEDVYDIDRGHKYSMDAKVVFDASGNGRVVVTRDGVELVDYKGAVGYNGQNNVYWAEGIYRDGAATETVVAEYSSLKIERGDAVTFPSSDAYVAAPKLKVSSVGGVEADGSRQVLVSGETKPGATVTLTDGTKVIGVGKADANGIAAISVKIPAGAESYLHAFATDAAGHKGIDAKPVAIEIGTSAQIVGKLVAFAKQGDVAAIVITDSPVLKIPAGQLSYYMRAAESSLSKIQGTYSFLESGSVAGLSYNRQDIAYTSQGVRTETFRYLNDKLVYNAKDHADGSFETWSVNTKGGYDLSQFSKTGTLLRLEQYDSAGKLSFVQVNNSNGSADTYHYNVATGLVTIHGVLFADKTRVNEELNIVGRAYTKQTYTYDSAGKLVLQERFEADGTKIFASKTPVNGARELHSYDGVTGKEISYTIYPTDGSRIEGKFDVLGKAYTGIVTYYSAANKVVGTDTYNAAGKLLSSDRWNPDGSHTVYTIDAAGVATGFKLYLANGTVTETVYPVVIKAPLTDPSGSALPDGSHVVTIVDAVTGQKTGFTIHLTDGGKRESVYAAGSQSVVEQIKIFDATGRLVSTDTFNAGGKLLAHEVRNLDGSIDTHRYNPLTGAENATTHISTTGQRTELSWDLSGRGYDKQTLVYDASNKLVESVRLTDGKVTMSHVVHADGTSTVISVATNGTWTELTKSADGKSQSIEMFNAAGKLTNINSVNADGSKDSDVFDPSTGKQLTATHREADGSWTQTTFNIQGRNYDKQTNTYDSSSKLVEGTRWMGDKLVMSHVVANGVDTTSTADSAGRVTDISKIFADGSRETVKFQFSSDPTSTTPLRVQEDHWSGGKKVWTDVTTAAGTHEQTAYGANVTLSSHAGVKDVFTSAGADRFVFDVGFGKDVINRFVTTGTAHDVIQLDKDLADDFSDLAFVQSGNDTVIAFGHNDTITLTNTKATQLTHDHFLFV